MKRTAVDYLIKEFSDILGDIKTTPIQDLLMVDALTKAKELFNQQIVDAFTTGNRQEHYDATETSGEQYYKNTFTK